jgi:protein-export membrane protein SecD
MNFKRKNAITLLVSIILISIVAGIFIYQPLWKKISNFRSWKLGLDLVGGSYLVYDIDLSDVEENDKSIVVKGLRDVIEKRVNLFGVSEPRVYTQKIKENQRLIVELAGAKDIDKAIAEIGETPVLDFREVSPVINSEDVSISKEGSTSTPLSLDLGTSTLSYIKTDLTGRYVKKAQIDFSQYTNEPLVFIEFTKEGAKIFEEITDRNVGKPLAIFLDNNLLTQPTVEQKIIGGKAQITGRFTREEAQTLVERFNAGALPAPITLVNQQTVSPTLGKNSLDKSIKAGIWGLLAVIVYMVIYYRKFGIVSSVSLLIYTTLVLGIFKIIPVTLTLSGIAGFILSIGIAVDANILVFERMKEELERGLVFSHAVEEGFKRAWSSIRDSNITTIISCIILFYLTSGFIQGFALTLLIGVLVSMFSAITITRTILRIFFKE